MNDEAWVEALHEEINQISRNEVWFLVPRPKDVNVIGKKWIFKNKMDENGVVWLWEIKLGWLLKDLSKLRELILMKPLLGLQDSNPFEYP